MDDKTHKLVFSINVANELVKKGYRIVEVKPSRKYRGFAVFVFENTPEFIEEFTKVSQQVKGNK